jgi:hypothetical protein
MTFVADDDFPPRREVIRNAGFGPDYPFRREEKPERSSDPISDHADLLDAVQLLKRWVHKHPDTDLGLKTLDWLKRRQLQGSILR